MYAEWKVFFPSIECYLHFRIILEIVRPLWMCEAEAHFWNWATLLLLLMCVWASAIQRCKQGKKNLCTLCTPSGTIILNSFTRIILLFVPMSFFSTRRFCLDKILFGNIFFPTLFVYHPLAMLNATPLSSDLSDDNNCMNATVVWRVQVERCFFFFVWSFVLRYA